MKPIKFRQPLYYKNKFHQWHYWGFLKEGEFVAPTNNIETWNKSQQYTGLKDKNGSEIYEGDIIKKENPSYWNNSYIPDAQDKKLFRGGIGYVIAVPFGFNIKEINCGEWCFNGPEGQEWYSTDITIIGNIYQNKELLDET